MLYWYSFIELYSVILSIIELVYRIILVIMSYIEFDLVNYIEFDWVSISSYIEFRFIDE